MTKSTKNYMLRLFIILGFLLLVFSMFYLFVLDTTLKNEANRLAFENHEMNHTVFIERLDALSSSYEDGNLSWPTKDYVSETLIPDTLAQIEINTLNNIFTDETSDITYLIIHHETLNQITYKPLNEVLSLAGLQFGQTGIIINNHGIVKYHSNTSLIDSNLFESTIFPSTIYSKLDTDLHQKTSGLLNYSVGADTFVLTFTKLTPNYFYINSQVQYAYLDLFTPIIWSFMALGLLTLIVFVIFGLTVVKRRFDDEIVFQKLSRSLKSNLLIVEAGGLGQLRQSNKLFDKLTSDLDFKLLSELTTEKIDIPQHLKLLTPFYLEMDKIQTPIRVRFIVNKFGRNYQLIGEIIDSTSNVLDKYKDLALTNHDSGLKNKLGLEEMIHTLDRKEKFSFIIMAIKSFDEVSKNIGRDKSKAVIQAMIELIQSKMYPNMYLFHVDRNEFVVLQQKEVNYDITVGWAKNMIELVDTKILLPDLPIKLEVNVGIVQNKGTITNQSAKEIIDALEITLERASLSTTNNLMIYTERYLDFRNKANQLEIDIRKGIENDEFQMFMQPQYDLAERRVVGFELLLRWNNPKYLKESPATYIRQAEKSNLIIDLGRVINEKVFQIAKKLEGKEIDVSFNISPRQLLQPGFINELITLRDKYQVDPNRIAIELTETLLILQMDLIVEKFNALKELNFKIQLDDFGTGYSSLNYLKRLPIDNIKIDKLFVDEVETSAKARQILKTMITLGKNLRMGVIIEGVENEKQIEYIKKETNAIIQGFFISRALPENEAMDFIKKKVKL